jgi:two-component system, cell cycle response regulator
MGIISKILIVDDEELGRDTIESLLIKEPYQLLFAKDGFEMLKVASDMQPDLVLLDVIMPGMDGFEACEKLRKDPTIAETPIIMVTALDDTDSRIRGIEAGADDFISKPFDRLELRARVKMISKLNRYRKLLTERNKYEWIINQAGEGYLVIKADNTIDFANDTAKRLLDITGSLDAQKKMNFFKIAEKKFRMEPAPLWEGWSEDHVAELTENHIRYLVRPESKTESESWLEISTFETPHAPEISILLKLSDVSDEMSNKQDFVNFQNMISHKLRTPFNGILMGLQVMNTQLLPNLDAKQKEFCDLTLKSANRYFNSLESILEYTRFSNIINKRDGVEANRIPKIIEDSCNNLNINTVNIQIQHDSGSVRLIFDENILDLILAKIFDNSKKFHPDQNPDIDVEIAITDSEFVRIRIGDNGVNLSPKQLLEMWGPYYQLEKSFTGEVMGMGLGLAFVATNLWHVGGRYASYNQNNRPGIIIELEIPVRI